MPVRRGRALPAAALLAIALAVVPGAVAAAPTPWTPSSSDVYQLILDATPTTTQLQAPFTVVELDGFDTPASVVAEVHRLDKHAVCYVDVGTWENWRPDAKDFPRSVLGRPDAGWPGERWLDVRRLGVLLPIMTRRIEMCEKKGFDAVDPDNVDGVDNDTGFKLTVREQLRYDRDVASIVHAHCMSVALKSFADQASALEGDFDFVVNEQCVQYEECTELLPFVQHKKAVFDIEYTKSLSFCSKLPADIDGLAKRLSLDAWVRWCP